MGKTKIKPIKEPVQSSVISSQLSEKSQSAVSHPETDKQITDKPESKNQKHQTDNKSTNDHAKRHSDKYQQAAEKVERSKKYPVKEAITLVEEVSYSKFPGSLEAHINTSTKNIRGLVTLPFVTGKKLTILAFGPSTALRVNKDAPEFEGVIWGNEETITEIEKGQINFDSGLTGVDVLITTPEWMPKLAKAARVLGPKGLMPNPKSGTITENLTKAVEDLKGGKTEYKTESQAPVIHLVIGKVNQPADEVHANIKALYNTIGKSKVKQITLSPTMGPGVKVDLASI